MRKDLNTVLDEFSQKYRGAIVRPKPVNVTSVFETVTGYEAPKVFGNLQKNVVLAYAVNGAPLLQKYETDAEGNLLREGGQPIMRPLEDDLIVMSCLCLADMKNTSLHEIRDALQTTRNIQGFRRRHVTNIISLLEQERQPFCIETDTAFLFSGKEKDLYPKIALNAMWLADILWSGHFMLGHMDETEAGLIEKVFPDAVLSGDLQAIRERSYMYGRPIHTPESVEFLARKVEIYNHFRT